METTLFRISSSSRPTAVAGAIAASIRDGHTVALQAIGAGAVNQAIKAISIARNFLGVDGLDIVCVPEFVVLDLDGNERSALRFHVDRPGKPFPPAKSMSARGALAGGPTPRTGE